MIERKEIAPVIIGGRTLFDRKDLDELIEKAKTAGENSVKGYRKPFSLILQELQEVLVGPPGDFPSGRSRRRLCAATSRIPEGLQVIPF
jgi:hypothetical protein